MAISALDHIVLNVADVERSLSFYAGVLGLAVERVDAWRKHEIGFPSVRINAATLIDLVQSPPDEPTLRTNLAHFCLVTDDSTLEDAIRTLAGKKIPIETGPARRWGARGNAESIYFRDPDDNLIELRTYAAHG
jgi:catechol 2,3-dioxygenase-like lactoylglutathione lyase family enzyme